MINALEKKTISGIFSLLTLSNFLSYSSSSAVHKNNTWQVKNGKIFKSLENALSYYFKCWHYKVGRKVSYISILASLSLTRYGRTIEHFRKSMAVNFIHSSSASTKLRYSKVVEHYPSVCWSIVKWYILGMGPNSKIVTRVLV